MDVSENSGTPTSSILIGFSIIFTIHFEVLVPLFLVQHPYGKVGVPGSKILEVPSEYPNRPEVAGRARGGGGMGNGSAFVGASQWVFW